MATQTRISRDAAASETRNVYVRGVRGDLGWRAAAALRDQDGVAIVVATGDMPADTHAGPFDTIVDIGLSDHDVIGSRGQSVTVGVADLLADADALDVAQLVVVSSALVYGALANNPVPLTEDAVLRPDPTFVYARQLAAAEATVEEWRAARPGRTVAMLRPAVPIAAGGTSSLARALTAGFGQRFGEADPGAQFVHHDDIGSAVALAVDRRLDGVYNVAPDGSIPGDRVRALTGGRVRLPLPDRLNDVIGNLRWRFQRGPIPPGLRPYTRHPWIIANDKLRAEGWVPTVTNEQVYVEGTEAKWWTMVTPKRRQEIALGGMIGLLGVVVLAAAVIGRRWWRRRDPR
ncbi:MAG: NAD-dependent epimerase/dehydratase family protein [Ilumatobacter sp.]|uniref:NAD-dependent epimerase/dehydratase family protein n=1 Tax=Ilumatobacter sp. TaxID=1967498 RepID=UPI002637A267|nr:NAD-dependent epimerase/dehydratase family protein [Ilumatobacter sp.]MDJ0771229.1 NAD-dependent epimerase/dehydratase family protein [Ilumatobacter sp.]